MDGGGNDLVVRPVVRGVRVGNRHVAHRGWCFLCGGLLGVRAGRREREGGDNGERESGGAKGTEYHRIVPFIHAPGRPGKRSAGGGRGRAGGGWVAASSCCGDYRCGGYSGWPVRRWLRRLRQRLPRSRRPSSL